MGLYDFSTGILTTLAEVIDSCPHRLVQSQGPSVPARYGGTRGYRVQGRQPQRANYRGPVTMCESCCTLHNTGGNDYRASDSLI